MIVLMRWSGPGRSLFGVGLLSGQTGAAPLVAPSAENTDMLRPADPSRPAADVTAAQVAATIGALLGGPFNIAGCANVSHVSNVCVVATPVEPSLNRMLEIKLPA